MCLFGEFSEITNKFQKSVIKTTAWKILVRLFKSGIGTDRIRKLYITLYSQVPRHDTTTFLYEMAAKNLD